MEEQKILQIQEELREMLLSHGVSDVGFTRLGWDDVQELDKRGLGVGRCRYGMSLVVRLSDAIIEEIKHEPTHTYFNHYRTVNAFIDQMLLRAGLLLTKHGYTYITVASSQSINKDGWNYEGRFSHKHMACHCGLGTIGKNSMFLHKEYGARVRLGSLFTDCPFPQKPAVPRSLCGECALCTSVCPAGAISGKEWNPTMKREELFDAEKCSNHMKNAYKHIGRGAVCGLCMRVCPQYRREGFLEE